MKKGMIIVLVAFVAAVCFTACGNEDVPSKEQPNTIQDIGIGGYFNTVNDTVWYTPIMQAGMDTVCMAPIPVLAVSWQVCAGDDELTPRICTLLGAEEQVIQIGDFFYEMSAVSEWGAWRYAGSQADLALINSNPPARFFCDRVITVSLYHNGRLYQGRDRMVFALGGRVESFGAGNTLFNVFLQATMEGCYFIHTYTDFRTVI